MQVISQQAADRIIEMETKLSDLTDQVNRLTMEVLIQTKRTQDKVDRLIFYYEHESIWRIIVRLLTKNARAVPVTGEAKA
jgi:hypothetical protein